jgi:hypothetical protein
MKDPAIWWMNDRIICGPALVSATDLTFPDIGGRRHTYTSEVWLPESGWCSYC